MQEGSTVCGVIAAFVYVLSGMYMSINLIKHRILISNVRCQRPGIGLDKCACLLRGSNNEVHTIVRSLNNNEPLHGPINKAVKKQGSHGQGLIIIITVSICKVKLQK